MGEKRVHMAVLGVWIHIIGYAPVLYHHALGLACGAGCVDEICQVIGRNFYIRVLCALAHAQGVYVLLFKQKLCAAVTKHMGDALLGVIRVKGYIRAARFERTQHGNQYAARAPQ